MYVLKPRYSQLLCVNFGNDAMIIPGLWKTPLEDVDIFALGSVANQTCEKRR